jgi:hypothetical protein
MTVRLMRTGDTMGIPNKLWKTTLTFYTAYDPSHRGPSGLLYELHDAYNDGETHMEYTTSYVEPGSESLPAGIERTAWVDAAGCAIQTE